MTPNSFRTYGVSLVSDSRRRNLEACESSVRVRPAYRMQDCSLRLCLRPAMNSLPGGILCLASALENECRLR